MAKNSQHIQMDLKPSFHFVRLERVREMKNYIIAILFLLCLLPMSFADIIADATLGTNVTVGPNYTVTAGTEKTNNLFHSFSEFNPQTAGDTVEFQVTANITHILFRQSPGINPDLDALLSSNGDGEKLTFLAQGQVSLSENFNLGANVTSFHAVSGTLVRHTNAAQLFTNATTSAQLSAVAPERLGGATATDEISVLSTGLVVQDTLALLAAKVNLDTANITANKIFIASDIGGELNINTGALVDSNGNSITPDGEFLSKDTAISLTDLGTLVIRAGSISFQDIDTNTQGISGKGITVQFDSGTTLSLSNTTVNTTSDTNAIAGGNVSFQANGNISFQSSSNLTTSHSNTGNAGSITITSADANISLEGNTDFFAQSAKGTSGAISLTANKGTISLTGGSELLANSTDTGNGANITLLARDNVSLVSSGIKTSGNAGGSISITSNNGNLEFSTNTDITAQGVNGAGGTITLSAAQGSITFTGGSEILGNATGTGNGGNISLTGKTDIAFNTSGINSGGNNAGNISITSTTGNVLFDATDVSMVSQNTSANQGTLTVQATEGTILFQNDSDVTGYGMDLKAKGNISFLTTSDMNVKAGGFKAASEEGSIAFNAALLTSQIGNVDIQAQTNVTFSSTSTVNTQGATLAANAGNVTIASQTGNIRLEGNTDILAQSVNGKAGSISLAAATGSITLIEGSSLLANATSNLGDGNSITINARQGLTIQDSVINSSGNNAGSVNISSFNGDIRFENNIDILAQSIAGNAGNVSLVTSNGSVVFLGGSDILSDSQGAGNGGNVEIKGKSGVSFTDSDIKTDGNNAGNLTIESSGGDIVFDGADIFCEALTPTENKGVVTMTATFGKIEFQDSKITAFSCDLQANQSISFSDNSDILLDIGNAKILSNTGSVNFNHSLLTAQEGDVEITGKQGVLFENTSNISTAGNSPGTVKITSVDGGVVFNSSSINTSGSGLNAGNTVEINASAAIQFTSSGITTRGANVTVASSDNTVAFAQSIIDTSFSNKAGDVSINGNAGIAFSQGANIVTNGATAGNVTLSSSNGISFDNTNISAITQSLMDGRSGGVVRINADSTVLFDNNSNINTEAKSGTEWLVDIQAGGAVSFLNSSDITSRDAGVRINTSRDILFDASRLSTNTQDNLKGGRISLNSGTNITFQNDAIIETAPKAGTEWVVEITAVGQISFSEGSDIISHGANVQLTTSSSKISIEDSKIQTGESGTNSGKVQITANQDISLIEAEIQTSSALNNAGNINLNSSGTIAFDKSTIQGEGLLGQGSVVTITSASSMSFTNGSSINISWNGGTSSMVNLESGGSLSFSGDSGIVTKKGGVKISSSNNIHFQDSYVNTRPIQASQDAGNIEISASQTVFLTNSTIDAIGNESQKITLRGDTLKIENSTITTGSEKGTIDIFSNNASQSSTIKSNSVMTTGTININGRMDAIQTVEFNATMINVNGVLTSDDTLTINADMKIASSALVRSSFTINGDVENEGSISPGNVEEQRTPLTIKINGEYQSSANSTIAVDVQSDGQYDKIETTGKTELDGKLFIVQSEDKKYLAGTKYNIITSEDDITGTFSSIDNRQISNYLFFDIDYQDHLVELMVKRVPYANFGFRDKRAIAVSNALDKRTDYQYGNDLTTILHDLDEEEVGTIETAFAQMSGESLSGLSNMGFRHTHIFTNTILSEIVGSEGDSKTSSPIYDFGHQSESMPLLAYNGEVKDLGTVQQEKKPDEKKRKEMGIFVRFMAGSGDQDSDGSEKTGYSFLTMGFAAGWNYYANTQWTLGFHTGYASSDLKYDDDGKSKAGVENIFAGFHARFSAERLYLYAMLGYSYSSFDQDREIIFSNVARTATSDFQGHSFYGSFHLGYDVYSKFEIHPDYYPENLIVTPVLGFQFVHQLVGEIQEKGAGDLNLSVDSQSLSSFRAELGVKFACPLKSDIVTLLPELRFLLIHEFMDTSKDLKATLAGNPGIPAKVPLSQEDKNIFLIGSRISANFHKAFSFILEYDAEFGSSSIFHSGKLTFQYDF